MFLLALVMESSPERTFGKLLEGTGMDNRTRTQILKMFDSSYLGHVKLNASKLDHQETFSDVSQGLCSQTVSHLFG